MDILKFSNEQAVKRYISEGYWKIDYKQWLLDNCAALWHTGEIGIIV